MTVNFDPVTSLWSNFVISLPDCCDLACDEGSQEKKEVNAFRKVFQNHEESPIPTGCTNSK
jgi:hypothetical protein